MLPWLLGALLFTGIAHAAHLHTPDAARGNDVLHCGLCLQFERLAAPPAALALVTAPTLLTWAPLPRAVAAVVDLFAHLYEARGPPRA
jgi:hypothetical protein